MQDIYIRSIFDELISVFNQSMQKDLDTNTTTTVTIFIVFLVVLVLVYLLFWWPIANKINNEVRARIDSLDPAHNIAAFNDPAEPDPEDQGDQRILKPNS